MTKLHPKDNSIHQIFTSKIKFRIYTLFEIYRKLTLQEIADKLSRSKSSIHSHVKQMIDIGILKSPTQIDEKRNNILEFTEDYAEKINLIDNEIDFKLGITPTLISQTSQIGIKWLQVEKSLLDEHIQFNKNIQKMLQNPKNIQEIVQLYQDIFKFKFDSKGKIILDDNDLPSSESISSNSIYYFDEDTYKDFRSEFFQLTAKYGKRLAKMMKIILIYVVQFVLAHCMPIEIIGEYNNRKDLKKNV